MLVRTIWAAAWALAFSVCAQATTISATATNLGGSVWRYEFQLSAFSNGAGAGFTIYFPLATVTALANPNAPADWDAILLDPDSPPGSDGAFDALALTGAPALSPFSVEATLAGGSVPLALRFEVYQLDPFQVLETGTTFDAGGGSAVPEPSGRQLTAAGLAIGLLSIRGRRLRRRVC